MSLKIELTKKIKAWNGIYSQDQVETFCRMWNYKISNGERRMREECNKKDPEIEAVLNKKKAIIGYRTLQAQGRMF